MNFLRRRWLPSALVTSLLTLAAGTEARADGTAQLGTAQGLRAGAVLYVDIVAPATEGIRWTGTGTVAVVDPNGTAVATLSSGQTATLTGKPAGAYRVTVASNQVTGSSWDLSATNPTDGGGRVFSYNWTFDAGSYAPAAATYGSFYAIVDGGGGSFRPVIELALDGLAGYVYDINANSIGIDGPLRGKSVPMSGNSVTPEFPIYLRVPSIATFDHADPAAYGLTYVGGTSTDVNGAAITPCDQIAPGQSEGLFQFTATATGSYHLQCDLDGDGQMTATNPDDLLVIGTTQVGLNVVSWDGRVNGTPVAPGTYPCKVEMTIGEFHYVGRDIETSYLGMRLYEVGVGGTRTPLTMFWDDSLVQSLSLTMPNGQTSLVSPGAAGMTPGAYGTTPVPNVSARAWGSFTATGKGNNTYLDTYTWLGGSTTSNIQVTAVDPLVDTDGDGVSDFVERCTLGTDPSDPDSDGDGTPDGAQYWAGSTPASTGGLESNGRLAAALAERAIRQRFGITPRAWFAASTLSAWAEGASLPGARAVISTPADLPQVTNAADVYGLDFVDGAGTNRGSVLLVASDGALYEHSKEICDRAHGAALELATDLTIDGHAMVMTRFRRADGAHDYAVALKLYAQGDQVAVEGGWLPESYSPVAAGQRVVNLQVWAADATDLQALVASLTSDWARRGLIVAAAPPAPDEEAAPLPVRTATSAPAAFVRAGGLLGETLDLTVQRRFTDGPLTLRLVGADAERGEHVVELGAVADGAQVAVRDTLPLFADVTVELVGRRGVLDRVWLSDGAWSRYDDGLWGGATTPTTSTTCATDPLAAGAAIRWFGCAETTALAVDQLAGVARHLARPLDLSTHRYLVAHVDASRAGTVCVESTTARAQACRALPAGAGWYAWRLDGFDPLAARTADLVTFAADAGGAIALKVNGLAVVDGELPPEVTEVTEAPTTGGGCSSAPSPSAAALVLAAIALSGRRRRRAAARR
ncbi:MAG: MYXO-CTERM sorting domain-containing protein [Kofleriaceae bacterium]